MRAIKLTSPGPGFLLKTALALVMLAAGLAVLTGFDRMGHRLDAVGTAFWMRFPLGALHLAAAAMLMMPRRLGYGAALTLVAGFGASLAHLAVLGLDSAPPAFAITGISAMLLWRNRGDLKH